MLVRFGFVAMSVTMVDASPSKTVTLKIYNQYKLKDAEAALDKVRQTARENLVNSLRLLRHCDAYNVKIYRFSSKIIPLATHPELAHWDYIRDLQPELTAIGDFVKEHKMRVTFHPDHFTLINSPKEEVFKSAVADLAHHCRILNAMGLDRTAKLIVHVGGGYNNKEQALEKFIENWARLPHGIAKRMSLENDDKTFTADETLYLCEKLQIPMVLDIHHYLCNPGEVNSFDEIVPRFVSTWEGTNLPPKIHVSTSKCDAAIRSHHDYVHPDSIYPFLTKYQNYTDNLDVMVEAKQKDKAMLWLVQQLGKKPGIKLINDATIEVMPD
jgi:UV DNA damage endonuclease